MQTDQFILTSLSFKKGLLCLNHFVLCNLKSGKQGKVQLPRTELQSLVVSQPRQSIAMKLLVSVITVM